VYGVGAIKFVDKQWNSQKAQDVHTVKFSYINFNSISTILGRVKVRFPNVENYVFRETNIICLGQLNAMADTQGLKSITIDPEGNHIVANNKNWRAYAIWRLNHWGLKSINGMEITEEEIAEAERTYNGLSDLVLWSLPESLLNPLFARLHVDEMLQSTKITPKEWLMKQSDESIRHVVGKEALQWKKTNAAQQEEAIVRRKGKLMFGHMMENTVNAVEKLQKLEFLWPNILLEMIRNTLIDYSQIDLYVRNLLSELHSSHNIAASSNASHNNNNNTHNNVINNTPK
jgi:leucine-rich repeat-containing protein 49